MKVIYNDIIDDGYVEKVTFDEVEICPICKHSIKPQKIYGGIVRDGVRASRLAILYYCNHCNNVFIAEYYDRATNKERDAIVYTKLGFVAPNKFEETIFDDCINKLSPTFVKIYNQSSQAESSGLDEIAGIGYRKALEFLVKDYCISKNQNKSDEIAKAHLGDCINKYIEDERIKNLAKVSTWIGNDETHYVRKFEDKDINDLKKFINTTVFFILYSINADEANNIINAQT